MKPSLLTSLFSEGCPRGDHSPTEEDWAGEAASDDLETVAWVAPAEPTCGACC
jgi:hypothetical protein